MSIDIRKKVILNTNNNRTLNDVNVKRGTSQTTTLEVIFYKDGGLLTLPSNAQANIKILKADKQPIYNTCSIVGNEVHITLSDQMVAAPGENKCEIVILHQEKTFISSTFLINIQDNVYDDEKALRSVPEYTTLIKALNDISTSVPKAEYALATANEAATILFQSQAIKDEIESTNSTALTTIEQTNTVKNQTITAKEDAIRATTNATKAKTDAEAATIEANVKIEEVEDRFNQLTAQQQMDAEVVDAREGEISLKANIDKVKSQLRQKASQEEVSVVNSRIDVLQALPSGATTNDARLEDIKIGADGIDYDSPAIAVREQIKEVKEVSIYNEYINLYYGHSSESLDASSSATAVTLSDISDHTLFDFSKHRYLIYIRAKFLEGSANKGTGMIYFRNGINNSNLLTQIATNDFKFKNTGVIEFAATYNGDEATSLYYPIIVVNGAGTESKTYYAEDIAIYVIKIQSGEEDKVLNLIKQYPMNEKRKLLYSSKNIIEKNTQDIAKIDTKIETIEEVLQKYIDNEVTRNIFCWGDSLTNGSGASTYGGVAYPTSLQKCLLGQYMVHNRGVGGENTKTISGRQGSMPYIVQPNVTIPATKTPVEITLLSDDGGVVAPLKQITDGSRGTNPVRINGIEGMLTLSNEKLYFTRTSEGSHMTIQRPMVLFTSGMKEYSDVIIIFMGQNGGWENVEELVKQHKKCIEYNGSNKYIILGITSSTASYRNVIEKAMYMEFGRHYINLREYIAQYGVYDYNITPTEQDLFDMAEGEIPQSLLIDTVHGNAYYYDIITRLIFQRGLELGYWEETDESRHSLSMNIIN